MTRLIEILISLAIVLGLFVVVGLMLPSKRHLVEKVETNRKLTIAFDSLNSLRRFDDSAFALNGQVGFCGWMRTGSNLLDTAAVRVYANSAT